MNTAKQLHRSRSNKQISGVAGGIAEYLNVDATLVRLVFVALAIINGVGLAIYLVAWLVMPEAPEESAHTKRKEDTMATQSEHTETDVEEPAGTAAVHHSAPANESDEHEPSRRHRHERGDNSGRMVSGLILIAIGTAFLLQQTLGVDVWRFSWPLAIIAVGLYVIAKRQ